MGVFRRAFLYLIRKKVRSILLFLILFSMGLFMLSGLSIRSSANRAAEDMRKSISSGLEIKMGDISGKEIYATSYNENGELVRTLKKPLITQSVAEELASVPGVSGYYSEMGAEILHTGLNIIPGGYAEDLKNLEKEGWPSDSEEVLACKASSKANDFRVVQESEYYPYFQNGAFELISGRHLHIDDTGKILISQELASKNKLNLGDVIDGQNYDLMTGELFGETYHGEIVGIFRINFEQQISELTAEPQILANTIFAPFELRHWGQRQYNTFYGGDVLAEEEDRLLGSITLFAEDPGDLEKIETQIKENDHVDWSYYTIHRYDADYKAAAKPLLSMTLFASSMVVIMIIGALLILSLVLAMWMRTRKHEINILTYLGISERMILAQFLTEMVIIVTAAFLMSCLFAPPVTRAMGDTMTELTSPSEETPAFHETYEVNTGNTYIHRAPVKQDPLSYQISYAASIGTFLAMVLASLGTVTFVFRRIHGSSLLSGKASHIHHWSFLKIRPKGRMKAHHRAFLYVTRKTGKSILLLFTLFVIMGLFLFGASIRSASEYAASELRESLGGYFKIIPDPQKDQGMHPIDQNLITTLQKMEGIKSTNAMDLCYMDAENFSLTPGKFSAEGDNKANMTRILGNTDSSLHEYFSLEVFELAEGEHIGDSDTGKALISQELAQRNQLGVGDHFVISTSDEAVKNGAIEKTYHLEISGLFSDKQQASSMAAQMPECDIPSNFIFTDITTSQQIMSDMQPGRKPFYSNGAAFFVKDPKGLEKFVQSLTADGILNENYYKLTINNSSYQKSMEPLNRLSNMSLIMLAVITGVGIILLTLILTMWERDRIHETGILMSFGILKRNIWRQRIIECTSIFIASFLLSIMVFLPVGAKMGNWLYEQTSARTEQIIETSEQEHMATWETVNTGAIENEVAFHMELSPALIIFCGLGGIVFVSSSMSMAFFASAHHKPKELLSAME